MQLTISSDDDLDHVLDVVGALLGVRLTVADETDDTAFALSTDEDGGDKVAKTRE